MRLLAGLPVQLDLVSWLESFRQSGEGAKPWAIRSLRLAIDPEHELTSLSLRPSDRLETSCTGTGMGNSGKNNRSIRQRHRNGLEGGLWIVHEDGRARHEGGRNLSL